MIRFPRVEPTEPEAPEAPVPAPEPVVTTDITVDGRSVNVHVNGRFDHQAMVGLTKRMSHATSEIS